MDVPRRGQRCMNLREVEAYVSGLQLASCGCAGEQEAAQYFELEERYSIPWLHSLMQLCQLLMLQKYG